MDIHRFHLFHSLRTKCVNWWRDPTLFVPARIGASATRSWKNMGPLSRSSFPLDRPDALLQPLGKQVTGSPTVAVCGFLQRGFQWLQQRGLQVLSKLVLLDGLVDGSKSWLLVIVENSSVTMENEDTGLFRLFTVAAIDTVVWTVVPLAGEHIQALWIMVKYDIKKVLVPPCNIQFVLLEEWQQDFLPAQSSCSHVI